MQRSSDYTCHTSPTAGRRTDEDSFSFIHSYKRMEGNRVGFRSARAP